VEAAAKQQQAQVAQAHQAAALENAKLKSAPTGWRTTAAAAGGSIPKGSRMGQPAGVEPILPSGNQKFIDMTQPDEVSCCICGRHQDLTRNIAHNDSFNSYFIYKRIRLDWNHPVEHPPSSLEVLLLQHSSQLNKMHSSTMPVLNANSST
jgi:hypothetical protein